MPPDVPSSNRLQVKQEIASLGSHVDASSDEAERLLEVQQRLQAGDALGSYKLLQRLADQSVQRAANVDLSRASVVSQLGDAEKARRIYDGIVSRQPGNADALIGLSGTLATLGDQAGADRALERCSNVLSDADVQGQLSLAMAYDRRYMTPRALVHARKALQAAPKDPGVVYSTAGLLVKLHQFEEAINLLQGALRTSPDVGPLHRLMAQILVDPLNPHADAALAEHHYIRALTIDPNDTKAAEGLGRLMLDRNRPRQAVYALNLLLRNEPRSSAGRMLIARAFSMLGDESTAAAQRRVANRLVTFECEENRLLARCRLEKGSPAPRVALSRLYASNGDFRRALTNAESAYFLAPLSSAADAQLAAVCSQLGMEKPVLDTGAERRDATARQGSTGP